MPGLYIGSSQGYSGKNTIITALGAMLQADGRSVGFMSPVAAAGPGADFREADSDAKFIQRALTLTQDPALVTPVKADAAFVHNAFAHGCGDALEHIASAYKQLSQGRDVMLIRGSGSFLHTGKYCGIEGAVVAQKLGAKVLLLDRFNQTHDYDYFLFAREAIGDALLGVVFNETPFAMADEVTNTITPMLEKKGVPVLGMLPPDPPMAGIRVDKLAKRLKANVICGAENTGNMVENILIGAMQVQNFMTHFRKHKHPAVIVGGDRSDLQLVALEGGCPCLILTGNLYPLDVVLTRAEALRIPILVAEQDSYTLAKDIGRILASQKFHDDAKIERVVNLVGSHLDYDRLKKGLGL